MVALMESLGRARDKGEPAPEWTQDLDKHWLAAVCHSDKRTVDRDLAYLETSGMAQIRHTIRNMICIRLCFRDWPNLPDYQAPVKENAPSEEPEDESDTAFKLLKTPCHVKAGAYSEPINIERPVNSFRLRVAGDSDIAFTAEIRGGRFVVTTKAVNVSNDLRSSARHACPEKDAGQSNAKGEVKAKGEEIAKGEAKAKHPRADELERLFDPILLRSCGRLLSADTVAFSQALDALGDLPHDFLVKFVIQRAERPISSPKVCASIVKDALLNWRASKDLPPAMPVQRSRRMTPTEQAIELAKRRRQERA
jgi:hypothetical protein